MNPPPPPPPPPDLHCGLRHRAHCWEEETAPGREQPRARAGSHDCRLHSGPHQCHGRGRKRKRRRRPHSLPRFCPRFRGHLRVAPALVDNAVRDGSVCPSFPPFFQGRDTSQRKPRRQTHPAFLDSPTESFFLCVFLVLIRLHRESDNPIAIDYSVSPSFQLIKLTVYTGQYERKHEPYFTSLIW